jgi:hypothetical protein
MGNDNPTDEYLMTGLPTAELCNCSPGTLPGNLTLCSMFGSDFATTGIIVPCNTTTVMTYDPLPTLGASYTVPTMAAALVSYNGANQTLRRDELVFTMSCARWQISCLVMSHFSLSWLMHDIIPGQRRVLLKAQVGLGKIPETNSSKVLFIAAGPARHAIFGHS